jgi:MFS family permease
VVAEIVPPKRRARINGSRWALVSLVTAVVVAVCGTMLEWIPFPINYQLVFGISFLGGLLSAYLFSRIERPSDSKPQAASVQAVELLPRLQGYVRSFAETPIFLRYLFTSFVLRFGLHLPAALYSIYWVRNLNASDAWIGWRSTASSLALIVGYLLWGRIATRKGHHLVLLVCTIAVGSYPVLTALTPSQAWLPLVAVVWGLFITGIDVSIFDTLLSVCPEDKRPSFVAVNTLFAHLAIFLAPMAGSLLSEWLDIRVVLFTAGGIHLMAALLFRLLRVAAEELA